MFYLLAANTDAKNDEQNNPQSYFHTHFFNTGWFLPRIIQVQPTVQEKN
jgi:hypothetical protein